MPYPIRWSSRAVGDLNRLAEFLKQKNLQSARRAVSDINKGVQLLSEMPNLGILLEDEQRREYVVPFGKGAYVIRYRFNGEFIAILRLFHSREDRRTN